MTKYGYIRVSTAGQADNYSILNQKEGIKAHGVEENHFFIETYTGTTLDRPELKKLMSIVVPNDSIYVLRLDRFARTTKEAFLLILELKKNDVKLIPLDIPSIQEPIMQELIYAIVLFFAEFENKQRMARQKEGIQRAKIEGKYKGRKSVITPSLKQKIKTFLSKEDFKKAHIASILKVSRATVYRALQEIEND